jgi:hypothetical protein
MAEVLVTSLALMTIGGRSVGIVRLWTKAKELLLCSSDGKREYRILVRNLLRAAFGRPRRQKDNIQINLIGIGFERPASIPGMRSAGAYSFMMACRNFFYYMYITSSAWQAE